MPDDSDRASVRQRASVPSERLVAALAGLFFVTGITLRLAPLFDAGGRLLRSFPTEDGYLSLTIARNLALGKGMSVSDGTILTNGTQPLATVVWAALFALVGGERVAGVSAVLLAELAIALGAAWLISLLAREFVGSAPRAKLFSWLAASAWFASPVVLAHTMNCLETGLYAASVVALTLLYVRASRTAGPWTGRTVALFGVMMGLVFLARNDGVFLCAAVVLSHLVSPLGATRLRRLGEAVGMGVLALVVGSPWLWYNISTFGHPVPVSGRAEAIAAKFGGNLVALPGILLEYVGLFVPVPKSVEEHLVFAIAAALALGALLYAVGRAARGVRSPVTQRTLVVVATYAALLSVYYGFFFGAGWFLNRYLMPLSCFFAAGWAVAGLRWSESRARWFLAPVAAGCLALAVGLGYRGYARGAAHQHFQVVEWVDANVAPAQWIGAVQSGTLGFFHDRTLNLDGKVSPAAFAARTEHRIPEYAEGAGVDFLVDWHGIASWAKMPALASFEVLVADPVRNLAVLRRKGAKTLPELAAERGATPSSSSP
jgi:hypothetical protein